MPVVGHRRDESIGVPASGAVAGVRRPIPLARIIETRRGGIRIAARGVVNAARLQIPCGESSGCSADDESRCECNLGLVQHCCISLSCISLSRFRPEPLVDRQVARRHLLTFRSRNLILEFNGSCLSDERCLQPQSCRGLGATRGEAEAGDLNVMMQSKKPQQGCWGSSSADLFCRSKTIRVARMSARVARMSAQ